MARLNEPAPSAESVDLLKRRFLRQNRELTKSNSTQSMRIRCLEAEVSRLLTENLELRQATLELQNALDAAPTRPLLDEFRKELAGKIGGLQTLLAQWDDFGSAKSQREAPTRAAEQYERKRSEPPPELHGLIEKMPTIREDKAYPRKTMEAREIQALADGAIESPDIGSPPIAHYDEEVAKFDPMPKATNKTEEVPSIFDTAELAAALPSNLETRRKRKDVGSKIIIRRMSDFQSPEEAVRREHGPPIRAGAKRKLEVREDAAVDAGKTGAEFEYSRRPALETKPRHETEMSSAIERRSSVGGGRRALGNKNANPVSALATAKVEKEKDRHAEITSKPELVLLPPATVLERSTLRSDGRTIVDRDADPLVVLTSTDDLPLSPLTTDTDIFSPPSTAMSPARRATKDTPPPSSLSATSAAIEATSRRAGRTRAPVSYAEPSLATKMRRPTKELVDAVGRDGRPMSVRTSVSRGPEEDETSPSRRRDSGVIATVRIKKEALEEPMRQLDAVAAPSRRSTLDRRPSLSVFDFDEGSPPIAAAIKEPRAGRIAARRRSMQL